MAIVWTVLLIGVLTASSTLVGGSVVLRYRPTVDVLLGFSSGAVIGVALFDLLPEALNTAGEAHSHFAMTSAVAAGFILYLSADRLSRASSAAWTARRHLGPASLTLHSLLDGLGIGLALQVSPGAGVVVGVAVLAHDFIDGANTIVLSLDGGADQSTARAWLAADAVAPLLGIALASWLVISTFALAILLAIFAGFFLYVGASELLPRSQVGTPKLVTTAATVGGMALIFAVTFLATQ